MAGIVGNGESSVCDGNWMTAITNSTSDYTIRQMKDFTIINMR